MNIQLSVNVIVRTAEVQGFPSVYWLYSGSNGNAFYIVTHALGSACVCIKG